MEKAVFEKMMRMLASDNDADAVLGLRGIQALLAERGTNLATVLTYALERVGDLPAEGQTVDAQASAFMMPAASVQPPLAVSGMPQCRVARTGLLEIRVPGDTRAHQVELTGEAAADAQNVADGLKDAMVAAVINKSRFKLKLYDIQNARGDVVEVTLRAEYDREGMTPLRIWSHAIKGEVAALAAVLRKAVANAAPDFIAA
jgi:hypothetical protein